MMYYNNAALKSLCDDTSYIALGNQLRTLHVEFLTARDAQY